MPFIRVVRWRAHGGVSSEASNFGAILEAAGTEPEPLRASQPSNKTGAKLALWRARGRGIYRDRGEMFEAAAKRAELPVFLGKNGGGGRS